MSDLIKIKDAIDELGKSHKEYRDTNDERLRALEKGDTGAARELEQKLERIERDVAKYSSVKEQLDRMERFAEEEKARREELEARLGEPKFNQYEKAQHTHYQTFEKALRAQFNDRDANHELKQCESKMAELKAVTIGTPAAGGYAVPEQIATAIEKLERRLSPVRDLVKVVPVGTSDYKELVSIGGAASGWVGESGSRTETGTPQLREVAPTFGELYAYPQASEWSLDDAFFSIEQWLQEETAEEFAYQEGIAVISGNGTNKPTGMLNAAPVTTADEASPLRGAEAYQFIASDATPAEVLPDSLIDLVYALNRRYRQGATWVMNSATMGAVRKIKDSNNDYLWRPGLERGEPAQLLGYPTATWEDMDDVANGNHPIAFGNFNRGYLLADRVGLRITVDQVTNPGFIRYYIRRREGGKPLNNDAIKFLKTT